MAGPSGVGDCGAVRRVELIMGFACLVLSMAALGCSGPAASSAPTVSVSVSVDMSTAMADPADTVQLFADLAVEVAPLAVYAPSVLPDGAMLASSWAPVIGSPDPDTYDGPPRRNPYVVGCGADAEAQVVYTVGDGWLVIVENFHGDLGDVAGENVGSIEGSRADSFSVNGGELVQWSKNACWYGVFGRGLSKDVILAAALGMKVMR